jgi:hypothetical protein
MLTEKKIQSVRVVPTSGSNNQPLKDTNITDGKREKNQASEAHSADAAGYSELHESESTSAPAGRGI